MKTFCRQLAAFLLFVASVGVAGLYGNFVQLHLGSFFILEALFLGWLLFAALGSAEKLVETLLSLWAPILFFGWGLFRLTSDVVTHVDELRADPLLLLRTVQHSILFIYPLLWIWAGGWLARQERSWQRGILFGILIANAIPGLWGRHIENLSLGSLMAITVVYFWARTKSRKSYAIYAVLASYDAFFPLWKMWAHHEVQRMTLLLSVILIVATAGLLRSVRGFILSIATLFLGIVLIQSWQQGSLSTDFSSRIQHSEDLPDPKKGETAPSSFPIQANARRFWWNSALEQWQANKILGIGMLPEVPAMLDETYPNTWETIRTQPQFRSARPVSGPHNSYLSILVRLGIVGAAIFAVLLAYLAIGVWPLLKSTRPTIQAILVLLIPLSGFLYAALNVGLEAPQNCMLLWFCSGLALELAKKVPAPA